ncbi:putative ATPase [Mycoplasmopsis mustelae]|uniref:Putative ATPase n=2 Tax=Mycoplasmopsis mustelae TaxID=171289 RepID=A0A4R7UCZ7_9BACT|nr:replication-associated recombination protein A [Mycoplasmopsis mustelae]TDV23059.1 putative ATPase [Mycoplasmopsis mustelae]
MKKNLANQLRPEKLEDIVGQEHIKKLLKEVIENKITSSFLFFGESGIGKTTTALMLAKQLNLKSGYFNASVDSKADLIKILDNSEVIIIDEIHRLNKDKQDILLSYLEFDKIIVYATTTENPYFKVNPAVRSRMQILQFYKISENEIAAALRKIINKRFQHLNISDANLLNLAQYSAGDLRASINNLNLLALLKKDNQEVSQSDLKTIVPNINFYSDAKQTAHYNNLSAFHKSLRGSDVDAALYYGFLILQSGDYDGLFRRMLAMAYEDIGLANPLVALKIETAIRVFERLGLPEGELALTTAIIELATSPKSNSVVIARDKVKAMLSEGKIYQIPKHLKDAHYKSATKLGDGVNYQYPHNFFMHWTQQNYLPNELLNTKFYHPCNNSNEQKIQNYWKQLKNDWKAYYNKTKEK